jgi:hypothetical protein
MICCKELEEKIGTEELWNVYPSPSSDKVFIKDHDGGMSIWLNDGPHQIKIKFCPFCGTKIDSLGN